MAYHKKEESQSHPITPPTLEVNPKQTTYAEALKGVPSLAGTPYFATAHFYISGKLKHYVAAQSLTAQLTTCRIYIVQARYFLVCGNARR